MNPDSIAAMAARPATIRRLQRLQALIAEFGTRDMNVAAVSVFLQCAPTAARNYLNDLLEASVIGPVRSEFGSDGKRRNAYRLNRDPSLAQNFLANVRDMQCCEAVLKRPRKPTNKAQAYGSRHFHIMADDCYLSVKASLVVIRRDPLVAALFGPETQGTIALASLD